MAHAALSRKTSTSLGVIESAISNSAVRSICPSTWCTRSNIPFARGFLNVVGLRVIPYESHRYWKCNLNSLPLLYIKWRHRGYLHNQVLFTNLAIRSEVLSMISSAINSSLPLTVCQCSRSTTSNSAILNQLEAGSIMVRAIKAICKLSLPLRVYGPIRLTHKHSHGFVMTVLGGRCPYQCDRLLLIWHDLHDFVGDRMVVRIPFQYIAAFIVSLRHVCPGCCK